MDQSTQDLINQVEKILSQLDRKIDKALAEDMQTVFGDYTFLTLFHACLPPTRLGKKAAKMLVNKYKNLIPAEQS